MIINLLDPGLKDIGGHHLEWDHLISAELVAQGHTVTVYSHISFPPEAREAFHPRVTLVPLFRNDVYLHPSHHDSVAGEQLGFIDGATITAEDLKATATADLWLWPSLFAEQLYACALIRTDVPIAGCIQTGPKFLYSQGAGNWKYAGIKARNATLKMNIGVCGPVLHQEYGGLFGSDLPVQLLPLPNAGCPGNTPKTELKTIGFFGHQREEKGAQLIPDLVSVLLRDGYQVILHDSANVFNSGNIPGLKRIGFVPDISAEIARCDLVVLPYNAKFYRTRESAVVWDALASGVPLVVPRGTSAGRRVMTEGAGRVFNFWTVDSIYRAILDARQDYQQIAAAAFQTGQDWRHTHGISKLVQALIGDFFKTSEAGNTPETAPHSAAPKRARYIAFYLPQFHPIRENDAWWGKGFTEWTNTGKARPLFVDHYQPHIPADLGYYDLRVAETRQAQADLAQSYGIEAFCYWHYWFAGHQLLERPFDEVLKSGRPDFPFCLGWANQTWSGIWHGAPDRVLIEQTYPGLDDYKAHFEVLIPAFRDPRYLRVNGRPLFVVFAAYELPDPHVFTACWQELAHKSGLGGIHFVAFNVRDPESYGCQACVDNAPFVAMDAPVEPVIPLCGELVPRVARYADMVQYLKQYQLSDHEYPIVVPNWDNTPRSGTNGFVLSGSTPELFGETLEDAVGKAEQKPDPEERIIFIKSWNEWAEGNHLEPDLLYGHRYLEMVRKSLL